MSMSLLQRLLAVPDVINQRPEIRRQGRHLSADMGIVINETMAVFHIVKGYIQAVSPPPLVMPSCDFSIAARAEIWQEFWQLGPPPRRHDIMGLLRAGDVTFSGNLQPMMANLFYVKAVLEAPRQLAARS